MRPKFSVCSDYLGPAKKHWMLESKRGTHSSIGPKISLAAVVVVAGVIGISGIDPQVIDAGWMQDSPTHPPKMSLSIPTAKRSGIVAAIPLPPPRALTAGEATAFSPRPAVAPLAATGMPLAVAEVPDAQAKTNTLPPKLAPAGVAKLADKSRAALVVKKVVVVQKKAAQVEHHQRSHSGTYVQNGGWGWSGGGWTGYSSFSNSRSF
jgi:hypothetical protein